MTTWPCNSTELTRRLGYPVNVGIENTHVRPILKRLGCRKTGEARSAQWIISEKIALKVAAELGRSLR